MPQTVPPSMPHAAPLPTEAEKVAFLSRAAVWPHRPATVGVIETHMSWVFVAGARVFKLKKPLRTAFLDFSTPARRARAVAAEVRLNRRLAPGVYLGTRALRLDTLGALTLADRGPAVDWLVEMRRLPEDRSLQALIARGAAAPADLAPVANLLAGFYRRLPAAAIAPGAYADRFAREHAETARVLRDPGLALGAPGLDAALARFEAALDAARPLLEDRVRAGRVVEGHGDLRPEHVFLTSPPAIIDCLEFNRGLRTVDPFDEIAFLGLECARMGAGWVLPEMCARLGAALKDRPDPALLAFYWRYRALLRARLALLHLAAPRVRAAASWRPLARRYLGLADEGALRFPPR